MGILLPMSAARQWHGRTLLSGSFDHIARSNPSGNIAANVARVIIGQVFWIINCKCGYDTAALKACNKNVVIHGCFP
jgi:hypothetical protein